MAPKKHSAQARRRLNSISRGVANTRLQARRKALQQLNALVADVLPGMDKLGTRDLSAKAFEESLFERILRALNRRCARGHQRRQLDAIVQSWVDNKGKLPPGLRLVEASHGPCMEDVHGAGDETAPALVPGHRVLKASFVLKSKAFMLTHNSRAFTRDDWLSYKQWAEGFANKHGAWAWAVCWEESLHATDEGVYHGHCYFIWTDGVGVRMENVQPLVFHGVRPRVDRCFTKTNDTTPRAASLHGLWYVTVMKQGTVGAETNYQPFSDYLPLASWMESLWSKAKLDHTEFLALSARLRNGHTKRKRDAMEVQRHEKEEAVRAHVERSTQELGSLTGFHTYPVVDDFQAAHRCPAQRRPMLVIIGATNYGKSELGAHVLLQLGQRHGLTEYDEITVEEDATIDLSSFDLRKHAGILLDGVADAMIIKKNREALQGRPKVCKGAKSATMMYAYPYTLCGRGVVATFDLSAANLDMFDTDHWLSNPKNCLVLRLASPAYGPESPLPAPEHPPATRADGMRTWSVAALSRFLVKADMEVPAQQLRAQGVSGDDFVDATFSVLHNDLRMSPFTSKKLLRIRDAYLVGL